MTPGDAARAGQAPILLRRQGAAQRRRRPSGTGHSAPRLALALALAAGALALALTMPRVAQAQSLDRSWRDRFDRGVRELRERRCRDAIRTFEQLVKARPERPEPPYNIACAYAQLGDAKQALSWLDRAVVAGFDDVAHVDNDADLDPLRSAPAFAELMAQRFGRAVGPPPLRTLDGQPASLWKLRGRVVLLWFWRADAPACREMLPVLLELEREQRARGLTVVGISADPNDAQERFADEHKVPFPLLRRVGKLPRPLAGIRAVPTAILLDAKGIERARLTGAASLPDLEAVVDAAFSPKTRRRKSPRPSRTRSF